MLCKVDANALKGLLNIVAGSVACSLSVTTHDDGGAGSEMGRCLAETNRHQ